MLNKVRIKFIVGCLKIEKVTINHNNTVKFYIVYEINLWLFNLDSKFTIGNSFFCANKLIKKSGPGNYFYSGHDTRFDACELFSLLDG